MKKTFICIVLFFLSFNLILTAQDLSLWQKEIENWQAEMNNEFANAMTSPLTKEDLAVFKELSFFAPNPKFLVKAKLKLTPKSEPFQMKTSKTKVVSYRQYGVFHFKINGKRFSLCAYQKAEIITTDEYANYLFIPFTDLTNGKESYIGGRYLDCAIKADNKYYLDFNKAYNPYCAYNNKYSCPIPPSENALNIRIEAGVMNYKNSH